MGSATKKQYFLLVREGGPKTLAALKGKVLITTLAKQPRFLSRVVFGKTIDVTKHFVLKRTRRSLRGIRKVSREQADATLVDEAAYAHLKELPLKRKLKAIYRSTTLPGLTLATTTGASATLKRALKRALKKVCSGEGKTLCRTFNVKTFSPAKAALYRKLTAAYQ